MEKWSKYNNLFFSTQYGGLLYNSITNSFAELDDETYSLLDAIKNKDEKSISDIGTELLEVLRKAKVITTKEEESNFFYKKKLHYFLRIFDRNILSLTIAPTLACNFRCEYCFENHKKGVMSLETEDQLVDFIISFNKVESVAITWFGGEPLMAIKTIKRILTKCKEKNVPIRHHYLVTNGYLLNNEARKVFTEFPLSNIQVTIDGNKETHNSRRRLGQNRDSYEKILSNIDKFIEISPNSFIAIRVNVDKSNVNEFINVYNNLGERWKGKNTIIYPGFVVNYNECVAHDCTLDQESRINLYFKLYKEHGLDIGFFPSFHIQTCVADNINGYVIGPDGEYYKCWNDVGIESKIIGSIKSNQITNPELFTKYTIGYSMYDDNECVDCLLFPICGGGCRWFRLNSPDDREKFICTHRKNHLNEFLELHYEQHLKTLSTSQNHEIC